MAQSTQDTIQTVAVLGAGVMGAGIAALLANAGCHVHLLDIVPEGAEDRNQLAKGAIDNHLNATKGSGFTHPANAERVIPGNLEDDMGVIAACDWIIEAVIENLGIKQQMYRDVEARRRDGSIVSSNTSTLPLHVLIDGMGERFAQDFCLTHFFNPPRFMSLLEVSGGEQCRAEHIARLSQFADIHLGKQVVPCKDTPGFIANRIGVFWMMTALDEAQRHGVSVEEADALLSRPVGIPKTGVFGLYDLIGLDLMPEMARSMLSRLPERDPFHRLEAEPAMLKEMIAAGYTGRKGKGGFYKLEKQPDGSKQMYVRDLGSGEYRPKTAVELESLKAGKQGAGALVRHPDRGGTFVKAVLVRTLHYAASLVPEIADDMRYIDAAMRYGFGWQEGPFGLIDRLGDADRSGATWLAEICADYGLDVPPLLHAAKEKTFYKEQEGVHYALERNGGYQPLEFNEDSYTLGEKTYHTKPILSNNSARLWDLDDGITCLELTTKGNTLDDGAFDLIMAALERTEREFKGMVIASDGAHFSLGANLSIFLDQIDRGDVEAISKLIRKGQQTMTAMKYAPFPVVSASAGMALGGGCELLLHSDAVNAHIESYPGLVEVNVGLIPGWGGIKELVLRHCEALDSEASPNAPLSALQRVFGLLMYRHVAASAQEAQDMHIFGKESRLSMNTRRVLPDAKRLCESLAPDYVVPAERTTHIPQAEAKRVLGEMVEDWKAKGKLSDHDGVIAEHLSAILSGGDARPDPATGMIELREQSLFDLEHAHFIELSQTANTRERIAHMLKTNKPLFN